MGFDDFKVRSDASDLPEDPEPEVEPSEGDTSEGDSSGEFDSMAESSDSDTDSSLEPTEADTSSEYDATADPFATDSSTDTDSSFGDDATGSTSSHEPSDDPRIAPIEGDNPSGEDLRLDESPNSLFESMRSSLAKARDIEKRSLLDPDRKSDPRAEWSQVWQLATEALSTKSKDLHIAVFLIEAAVRRTGLSGLADGFMVMRELIERYWDTLYPPADDDGTFERRMQFVRGVDGGDRQGTLIRPIQMVAIMPGTGQGAVSLNDFREDPDSESVRAVTSRITPDIAVEIFTNATAASDELDKLREALAKFCGQDVPPTGNIREAVQAALRTATAIKEQFAPDTGDSEISGDTDSSDDSTSGSLSSSGTTSTRLEALEKLDEVARFFQDHDPHSFVGYGAAEVARWGRLALPELLAEFLSDSEGVRDALFKRVGLKLKDTPPPAEPTEY